MSRPPQLSFDLITPARNEVVNLPRLIDVMITQTRRPSRWLIVSDGSTDGTDDLVRRYLPAHPWMSLLTLSHVRERSFAAKATCFMAGYQHLASQAAIIGNLDADVSFDRDYLEFITDRFGEDAALGVAGTPFTESGYDSTSDSFEGEAHVPGGCQLFRRECFEQIGGYKTSPIGVDWIAVTTARYYGWRTRSFREKSFRHHRPLGTAGRGRFSAAFAYGAKDHILGWHPAYEAARIAFQTLRNPLIGGCIAAGYVSASTRRLPRSVGADLIAFHRAEQLAALRAITRRLLKLKRPDPFSAR